MYPATAWDGDAREWTVLGRLRGRQRELVAERAAARKRINEAGRYAHMMTAALMERQMRDELSARWSGGFIVLAMLFSHPDSSAMRSLDERGDYFDIRSGETWDLFFPGYYRSTRGAHFESQCGARPVGRRFAGDWFFNPREFDRFRDQIETSANGLWHYSGETDLVLTTAYVPDKGEVTVDWESVVSGQLTDPGTGVQTMTLSAVVESLTRDILSGMADERYGVGPVVAAAPPASRSNGRDFVVSVLAEIAAALATKPLG